jgi:hypothetical protein
MKKIKLLSILFFCSSIAFGQSVTLTPNPGGVLLLKSNTSYYGNISTSNSSGADLFFRRAATGDGSTGIVVGQISTFPDRLLLTANAGHALWLGSNSSIPSMYLDVNGTIGIGTSTPAAKLDVKTLNPNVARFNGGSSTHLTIFENDIYRGYWGSYSGADEDMDFGTGGSNTTGKLHLTIQGNPQLSINSSGNVGLGVTDATAKLEVNGFSKLGSSAPAIKMVKLTGTTAATQGGFVYIPHGLISSKILAVNILVEFISGSFISANNSTSFGSGFNFDFDISAANITVVNKAADSYNITSRPMKILITYEQ